MTIKNTKKKTVLKRAVKFSSVEFNPIGTIDILDIDKYLMKRTWYEKMFRLIKKMFIRILTGLANGSNHRQCVFDSTYHY